MRVYDGIPGCWTGLTEERVPFAVKRKRKRRSRGDHSEASPTGGSRVAGGARSPEETRSEGRSDRLVGRGRPGLCRMSATARWISDREKRRMFEVTSRGDSGASGS